MKAFVNPVRAVITTLLACACCTHTLAQNANLPTYATAEPLGAAMENWTYPYPVQMLQFDMEGRTVRMAFMDVKPVEPNGQTIVLMHGKNFSSDYWVNTQRTMSSYGYRVIAADQIGFGKSSKPEIKYTYAMLAENTVRLLDHLKLNRVILVGHSMGGMLAVHFARRYPDRVSALVLENPLGLEDYAKSIAPQETGNLAKQEMMQTPASYRDFLKSYFPNWKPEFERMVEQFARVQFSGDYPRLAAVSALTYQMIYEGPIYDELPKLTAPTLLVIGQLDRTVLGRRFASTEDAKSLGNFPQLGRSTQQRIRGAVLKEFNNVGHVPHLEQPERFHAVLQDFIYSRK